MQESVDARIVISSLGPKKIEVAEPPEDREEENCLYKAAGGEKLSKKRDLSFKVALAVRSNFPVWKLSTGREITLV